MALSLMLPQNTEKINRALQVLQDRRVLETCPRCKVSSWTAELIALAVSPLPPQGGGMTLGGYIPALSLTCNNCGVVFTHNLISLGLTP